MRVDLEIRPDAQSLFRAGAEVFRRTASRCVRESGVFNVALAGGNTPRALYALLANDSERRHAMPWKKMHFFWGDERSVPPNHIDSNFCMAWDELLSKVPVPQSNIHRIRAELGREAALEYEQTLRHCMRVADGALPQFDLVLLGLGADAHTASLFPETQALTEMSRWVVANTVSKLSTTRITLTAPVLNNAAVILFMVSGADKAQALRTVLHGKHQPNQFPAQLIRPHHGQLLWRVDASAASLIQGEMNHDARRGISV